MALSGRLRVAMERKVRATALPAYLERMRSELGITLERNDLRTDDARDTLREARLDAQRQAMTQESERRTDGLSAEDAEGLAAQLSTLLADQIVIVGFGQKVPTLARIPLHTILLVAPRAARQWGELFARTEDDTSTAWTCPSSTPCPPIPNRPKRAPMGNPPAAHRWAPTLAS